MTDIEIPEAAKQFFLTGVDSIAEWEAILLLRENLAVETDAQSLARDLYIGQAETEQILVKLEARGIVKKRDGEPPVFRYSPESKDLAEIITTCAGLYRKYLIPVTRIIHSEPKLRLRAFADAFRIRKN